MHQPSKALGLRIIGRLGETFVGNENEVFVFGASGAGSWVVRP